MLKKSSLGISFHTINELEIISVVTGVGKVSCASCVQLLISEFQPDELFMTGICGSLSNKVKNGHIVVALNAIQHDVTAAGSGKMFLIYITVEQHLLKQQNPCKKNKKYDHMIQYISVHFIRRSTYS